jgi:hypothetical protein
MRKPARVYTPREGHNLSKTEAQRLGTTIAALERKLRRAVTPGDLIEHGRDPDSPFHRYLDWDDAHAAHEYRLQQARYIMRAIDVQLPEYGDAVVRGFIPASYGPSDDGFMSTNQALAKRPDVVRLQLRRLRDEAVRIEKDYAGWASLIEFQPDPAAGPAADFVKSARRMAKATV